MVADVGPRNTKCRGILRRMEESYMLNMVPAI